MKETLRVLIAEDNPADAELILRELSRAGFEIEWERVDTEEEFRARLRPELDIILSDYAMPHFSGLRALEVSRERGLDIPFILISGTIGEETAVAAIRRGATDYLLKDRLTRLGSAVTHALNESRERRERRQAEAALRESEERFRESARTQIAILSALPAHIALLDPQGFIVAVNESWRRFAAANGLPGTDAAVGTNYLEVCGLAGGDCTDEAQGAGAGIRRVLRGEVPDFALEYPCHSPTEERWFQLTVNPLGENHHAGAVIMHINVTARRLAEEALRRSQADLQLSIDAARLGTWDWNIVTGAVAWSARCLAIYGIPPGGEVSYARFLEALHPDDRERIDAALRRAVEERTLYDEEKRVIWPDGSLHWTASRAQVYCDPAGQTVRMTGVTFDITERKQVEEALRLFRNLVDQSNDTFEVIDPETGRFLDVNANGPAELGCSREDYLKLRVCDIDTTLSPSSWTQLAERIRLAGSFSGEGRHRRNDGTTFPVEFSAKWVHLDRDYIVAAVRNITDRKRNEARFRRLVDCDLQGVMFWKMSGEITGANDEFLRIAGCSREDLEAGRIRWPKMTPPEYADRDQQALEELAARGVCTPFEKDNLRPDGSRVPVLVGAAVFEDNPEEGVSFVLDLTERKRIEQQFFRAQRMESIGTLAGGIAHDLNNVLGPMIMAVDLLKLRLTDPRELDLLDLMETSGRRGADMIKQVLSFARGIEGRRVKISAAELVNEMAGIARDTFPKSITVETDVPGTTWIVPGESTKIHQVLLNLCVNARDAMPHGGNLRISARNQQIDRHFAAMHPEAQPGPYVVFEVADNGEGMPPDVVARIFEPFFTTKEPGKGTGLGLSTTYAIVKSHGGFVRFESQPGTGTSFQVSLPAEPGLVESHDEAAEPELPRGRGETILLIDDEAAIRSITGQTLEAFGYRVMGAVDGADGVAKYAQHRNEIAAVVTDMMMPVMEGAAAIRVLRRLNPAVKIIATSGSLAKETEYEDADFFLAKPYTAETLLGTLHRLLSSER